MAKLTNQKKLKLYEMHHQGHNNSEIARALKISEKTVRNYVGENNDGPIQTTQDVKGSGKPARGGSGDTDGPGPAENPDDAGSQPQDSGASESIDFIGGRKHKAGVKDMSKETEKEKEWKCPECGHEWDGSPDRCPSCGAELED